MSCLGTNRLQNIYQELSNINKNDIYNRMNIERPEQELIAKFLPNRCCVLEMGGESGTTSLIINKILEDPTKHVLVEPSENSIPKLEFVKQTYHTKFNVVHGFVGRNRKMHEELWEECKYRKMYDLHELESIVKQKFDVLVIDCEGAFYNILNDIPEILESIKMIIIEMDGPDDKVPEVRNKLIENGFVLIHTQTHPFLNNGDKNNLEFGVFETVEDFNKIKCRKNMVGFHEVYVQYS